MKLTIVALAVLLTGTSLPLLAQLTQQYTYTPSLAIPDGNATGVSDAQIISASPITAIGSLTVGLTVSGNYNGDLYAYLRHETEATPGNFVTDGFTVLLNRTGRTLALLSGYNDSGFDVSFSDTAAQGDIHIYRTVAPPTPGTPLTGLWQPDGRTVDPAQSLDTSPRTTTLSTFDGLSPNGRWTLFAADLETGGTSMIDKWVLDFTAVPEPAVWGWTTALGLMAFGLYRRR